MVAAFTVGVALAPATVDAFVRPAFGTADGRLESLDAGTPVRSGRDVSFGVVSPAAYRAWARLEADLGDTWAVWDRATGVPVRILGGRLELPGVVADPRLAQREAETFLQRHLELLAPGATFDQFVLVTNHQSGGIRSVGFVQTIDGTPVRGGQISVRFKHDRLSLVASEAIPLRGVAVPPPAPPRPEADYVRVATQALQVSASTVEAHVEGEPVLLPLIDEAGLVALRRVVPVDVSVAEPRSRWTVFVDVRDGQAVAREPSLMFADASVSFRVPVRGPHGDRVDRPAPRLDATLDGVAVQGDDLGLITVPDGPSTLDIAATGAFVAVENQAGEPATLSSTIDGSTAIPPLLWDEPDDELIDAELTTYLYANEVKSYVRSIGSASEVEWIDEQLPARVNIDQSCNAFWDGKAGTINFFVANEDCENTGRLTDVVNHEFGHGIHSRSLIPGVGSMDVALSEGVSDYLAATIVDDPSMGRGFFFDERPIRELDPEGFEWHWPEDRGEVHAEGRIIGGALWDLRGELGVEATDRIWFEATRRASDIPTMYVEALLVDDDDGDLQNGTPNVCLITDVFGAHGLFQAAIEFSPPAVLPPSEDGHELEFSIENPFPQCGIETSALLEWRLRRQPDFGGQTPLVPAGDVFRVGLPKVPAGTVIQYRLVVRHDNSTTQTLPRNLNDPWYETFVGDVEPIYCTDFESDPAQDGWITGGDPEADEWAWGAPGGKSGDPAVAVSGTKVFGLDLGGDEGDGNGRYRGDGYSFARSPEIDVSDYAEVRLQYRRWLEVEDGYFDQANLLVNDEMAWTHLASEDENDASRHHRDGEWRFHDVDIADHVQDGKVRLTFELTSDAGLHMGGWTIDDLCVVGYVPVNVCGDAVLELGEDCDDGNTKNGDGCSKTCALESDDAGGTGGANGNDESDGCACDVDPIERPWRACVLLLALVAGAGWRRRFQRRLPR